MSDREFSATDLAVIQFVFASIPEEMGAALARTAFSPNIKERKDFSCALFDAGGRLLSQAAHIPVHLGAMPRSVEAVLAAFPNLRRGDVVMLNDPFQGGSHLPDITLVSPLFTDQGALSGYAATRAHHADVGGMTPGSLPHSTSIYQEGLRIPPVRMVREGEADGDLLRILCANSRNPEERRGDLRAQLQAHHIAEERWGALLARHGPDRTRDMADALRDYAERRMSAVLEKLPGGEWSREETLETDPPAVLRGTLDIREGRVKVDLTASDDAVEGSLNAVKAICESAVYYVFLCLLARESEGGLPPVNAGCFRDIAVETRKGSVLDAGWPHAVAGGNVETSQRVADLVLGLLEQAMPGEMPAQSQGTMNNVTLGGRTADGAPFAYYETLGGGAGASNVRAGAHAVQAHMTNTLNTPVEALEFAYPLRVRELSIRGGSGGGGLHRGGDGLVREWETRVPVEVTLLTGRRSTAPAGAGGGGPGAVGRQWRIGPDGSRAALPAKGSLRLAAGERLRVETPGGGGWGRP